MPRACVIVLDAVGAGELPDAADYGDEGSDTLGNVARVVGGLDLPNLEALGLGNVEQLADLGPFGAITANPELARCVNVIGGRLTYEAVAEAHGMEYTPLDDALAAGVA